MKRVLTAIIPIGNVRGNLYWLSETLKDSKKYGVQIIIVHDDFHDGTKEALQSLSSVSDEFQLIAGEYRAPGLARNQGLKNIDSDWFCFWDTDDKPNVKEYVEAISGITDNTKSVIVGNYSTKDEITGDIESENLIPNCRHKVEEIALSPGIWRFIFKTDRYRNKYFGPATMGEDQLFLAELNFTEKEIFFSQGEFYQYSINRDGQLTGDKKRSLELIEIVNIEHQLRQTPQNSKLIDYLVLKQTLTLMKFRKQMVPRIIWPAIVSMANLKGRTFIFLFKVLLKAK